jgi:uncharacterized membrane protein
MNFPTDSTQLMPALPLPVVIILAGTAALLAVILHWRRPRSNPLALLLRLGVIALLTVVLLNPSQMIGLPAKSGRSLLLVDDSASMSLAAEEGRTRWQSATQWVAAASAAIVAEGGPPPEVRTFSAPNTARGPADPWQEPTAPQTRLAAALEGIAAAAGSTKLDQVVVISDGGAHDRGRLSAALGSLRAAGLPVSTKCVGIDQPPLNASLASVRPPQVARPGARVELPVQVKASGYAAGDRLILTLRDEAGEELTRQEWTVPGTDAGLTEWPARLTFTAAPRTARYQLSLTGPAGEVTLEDNQFQFSIGIASAKLRVLIVEGTHVKRSVGTTGHWLNDIELMTAAWDATGEIEWECLTPLSEYVDRPNLVGVKEFANGEMRLDKARTFPKTAEDIHRFDVMMISDVPVGNFSEDQMRIVVDWVVERGGGFMMGGGYTSFDVGNYDKTPWEKIIPVDMLEYGDGFFEHSFGIEVPLSVRNHPIWQISPDPVENAAIIAGHPALTGMNRVRRAKPGALVLAVRPEADNEPVFAVQSYGRGRSIAYLSDPNGGWARNTVKWGPPGGPVQGPHTELGHGTKFVFDEVAAHAATGPRPPHPSPYYGQFWVNVVKWLGDNSIRWRRDQFAGRVLTTQATPGRDLQVAAEVLAVTSAAARQTLDVGARLDLAGSPRVRLTWDRDRREFTGTLRVPGEYSATEVKVLFDTSIPSGILTDAATAGVRRESQEFINPAPDPALLRELAEAGGGRSLTLAKDAAATGRTAAAARAAAQDSHPFFQPRWARWPWWTAIMLLLGLEWWIRRRSRHAAASPLTSTAPTP